ncbi:MAG TPA: helix-turn-helix domain-containing protein [Polyangia bacterium]|nr:helix-turn-helix domain-containing protein [Polyangia bacterium]
MKKRAQRRKSSDHRDEDLQLKNVIRNHIDMVLFLCEGNLSEAAVVLGIHRRTLQRMRRGKRIID